MFDHIQIKVDNFPQSRIFYETILKILGYEIVLEFDNVVGIGTSPHDMFEVVQASADKDLPLSSSVHIAFVAKSKEAVHDFYKTALRLGAQDNGAPRLRPEYEEGYFAAFVIDINGHNLEVVFKDSAPQLVIESFSSQ